jgi:hypothetical protein
MWLADEKKLYESHYTQPGPMASNNFRIAPQATGNGSTLRHPNPSFIHFIEDRIAAVNRARWSVCAARSSG